MDTNNQYYTNGDDGVVFNKDKTVLVLYPAGKKDTSYAIPDSVTATDAYGKNLPQMLTVLQVLQLQTQERFFANQ